MKIRAAVAVRSARTASAVAITESAQLIVVRSVLRASRMTGIWRSVRFFRVSCSRDVTPAENVFPFGDTAMNASNRMTSDKQARLRAAIVAVRNCADTMEAQAAGLLKALPTAAISEGLRANALELTEGLKDASGRVAFELALLQVELADESAEAATAVKRLSAMDATMMAAVAALTDVVDQLERAAERDAQYERAFVLVIETTGVLLQALENARAATEALGSARP